MGGKSYNGYDWLQRIKIIAAFRRQTGRQQPFEGAPCAMCGDPDRAAGQWHSEDYSEPFTFQPPESYPLCAVCHGRIHKRFNAAPGEWELFCLHLESGGYGGEFTRRWTLAERRALARSLADGAAVDLIQIRTRPPEPHWWRSLTLEPESLTASWARPRPLRPRPDTTAFTEALAIIKPSHLELSMLRAHAAAPRRTLTMRALAVQSLGRDDPKVANLLYGKLAHRLATQLGWPPDLRPDNSPVWMSMVAEGWQPQGREYEWTMLAAVAEATFLISETT
jgi:hypothetical protein